VLVNSLIRRPGVIPAALPWSGLSGPRSSRLPDLWPGKTASATDPLSFDRTPKGSQCCMSTTGAS
jgi:hypothetical protein